MTEHLLTLTNQCKLQGKKREKRKEKIFVASLYLYREHAPLYGKISQ